MISDFGFELVERRECEDGFVCVAMEKVEDTNLSRMLKPQLVVDKSGLFLVNNIDTDNLTWR